MKKLLSMLLLLATCYAVAAQRTSKQTMAKSKSDTSVLAKYTCEMHPEVLSNKPGKCPKCGMELTEVKTFTCEMHPEVVTNKPGKCPKCDMD